MSVTTELPSTGTTSGGVNPPVTGTSVHPVTQSTTEFPTGNYDKAQIILYVMSVGKTFTTDKITLTSNIATHVLYVSTISIISTTATLTTNFNKNFFYYCFFYF
jgi:hypothetical protein